MGRTVGLGAQHVVAMFGATFVFPLIMGLNPQLAIMMSGIATICFLLIVKGKVPSYLGTSARPSSAASSRSAPRAATPRDVTGAILVAGVVLAAGRRARSTSSAAGVICTRCCRRSSPAPSSC